MAQWIFKNAIIPCFYKNLLILNKELTNKYYIIKDEYNKNNIFVHIPKSYNNLNLLIDYYLDDIKYEKEIKNYNTILKNKLNKIDIPDKITYKKIHEIINLNENGENTLFYMIMLKMINKPNVHILDYNANYGYFMLACIMLNIKYTGICENIEINKRLKKIVKKYGKEQRIINSSNLNINDYDIIFLNNINIDIIYKKDSIIISTKEINNLELKSIIYNQHDIISHTSYFIYSV
jgi:hypothetical protein